MDPDPAYVAGDITVKHAHWIGLLDSGSALDHLEMPYKTRRHRSRW